MLTNYVSSCLGVHKGEDTAINWLWRFLGATRAFVLILGTNGREAGDDAAGIPLGHHNSLLSLGR